MRVALLKCCLTVQKFGAVDALALCYRTSRIRSIATSALFCSMQVDEMENVTKGGKEIGIKGSLLSSHSSQDDNSSRLV